MKTPLLALVATSLLALAGCQSSNTGSAANGQMFDVPGAQSRYSVQVPRDSADAKAPYAGQTPTIYAPNANDR